MSEYSEEFKAEIEAMDKTIKHWELIADHKCKGLGAKAQPSSVKVALSRVVSGDKFVNCFLCEFERTANKCEFINCRVCPLVKCNCTHCMELSYEEINDKSKFEDVEIEDIQDFISELRTIRTIMLKAQ